MSEWRPPDRRRVAAAEADEIVKSIFGAAAKEYREMHPDLNKYR
jgi:hypothetical protein